MFLRRKFPVGFSALWPAAGKARGAASASIENRAGVVWSRMRGWVPAHSARRCRCRQPSRTLTPRTRRTAHRFAMRLSPQVRGGKHPPAAHAAGLCASRFRTLRSRWLARVATPGLVPQIRRTRGILASARPLSALHRRATSTPSPRSRLHRAPPPSAAQHRPTRTLVLRPKPTLAPIVLWSRHTLPARPFPLRCPSPRWRAEAQHLRQLR